jgi:hypothetical protein
VKDVAYFVKRVAEPVEMQNFPVGRLFDEDGFSTAMLIATGDIVVKGELSGGCHSFCLCRLSNSNVLPFPLPLIFQEIEIDLVQAFIDGVGNDGFWLL